MAKKPATEQEAEAIERGLAAAKAYEAEAAEEEAASEAEAGEAAEVERKPRQRKFFDNTGVKAPEERVDVPEGIEPPEEVIVTTTRRLTIGTTTHPEGADISVPEPLGEVLLKGGNAVEPVEETNPIPESKRVRNDAPEPDED